MNDSPLTSDVVAIYLEINKDQVFNNWCLFFLICITTYAISLFCSSLSVPI